MRTSCILSLACVLVGCSTGSRESVDQGGSTPAIPRDKAVQLLMEYLTEKPDLAQWAQGEPFYVGDWNGYVAKCKTEGLIYSTGMSRWDTSGITVLVFRKPFLPIGGGREDFFTIDKAKKMYHVRGLIGR